MKRQGKRKPGQILKDPIVVKICVAVIVLWAVALSGFRSLPKAAVIVCSVTVAAAFALLLYSRPGRR